MWRVEPEQLQLELELNTCSNKFIWHVTMRNGMQKHPGGQDIVMDKLGLGVGLGLDSILASF